MVASSNIKKGFIIITIAFIFGLLIPTGNVVKNNAINSREMGGPNGSPRPSLVSAAYSTTIDLSDDALESLNPSIATDSKNNIHVVWSDGQYGSSAEKTFIYYKMYNYSTATWGSIVNVSLNNDKNIRPDIAVDQNDNVHVVWAGRQNQADGDIYYRNKTFATGAWSTPFNVTNDDEGSFFLETNPKIAINGTRDGFFNSPAGIAVNSAGQIYVLDKNNNRVQVFSSSGIFLFSWGSRGTGNGQFNAPSGIAVNSTGQIYILDKDNNRVQVFSASGIFLFSWGTIGNGNGQFNSPSGIAVNSTGYVYVTDTNNNRVQVFSKTGAFLFKWGSAGTDDGQFDAPNGIGTNGTGLVYVADSNNDRVQVFYPNGTFWYYWGFEGSLDGFFDNPTGIAVNSTGQIYVTDTNNNRVQVFQDGAFLFKWGTLGTGDSDFDAPACIATNGTGLVYVTDANNNRVQSFYANGTFISKWGFIGGGDVQVIWEDQLGAFAVIKGRVAPAGNWNLASATVTINSNGANNVWANGFDLAVDQNYFHLVWSIISDPDQVYYMNSSDGFLQDDGTDAYLLHNAPTAYQPTIFVANNSGGFVKIYTVWVSSIDGAYDILSKNSTDKNFFGSVVNVTAGLTPPDFKLPQVVADSTGLMFVLYAEGTGGNYRLRMTNSTAYGSYTEVQDPAHLIVSEILNNPVLSIDTHGSLNFAWEDDQAIGTYSGPANTDIFYRMYDRYPPHVSITSPGNFSLIGKYTSISGMTDTDTHYVNVSYQVKGQSSWNYINGTENDTTNFRNGWSVQWYPTVAYPNITIRANATDFNGASDEFFIYNVTVDAIDPVSIAFVNIVDSYGNNNATGASNFTGTITVSYTTADDALGTGVKTVALYDGSTLLSEYGTNDTRTQLVFNTGDAVYSNLKLRATDLAGNYLDSNVVPKNIRIDHTDPVPMFKNPLVNLTRYRSSLWIQVNASATYDDVDWHHVFFEESAGGSIWNPLGTNSSGQGQDWWRNWSYFFNIASIFEDPEYFLRATVFDNANRNVTIQARIYVDNNKPDFLIDVDWTNVVPVYDFTDDDYGQECGIEIKIAVLCDNDTTTVVFYNKTTSVGPFTTVLATNTTGQQYTADLKIFTATWNTFYSPDLTVFIKVVVIDSVGNSNSTDEYTDPRYLTNDPGGGGFMIILQLNVPSVATNVIATLASNKTAIIIEWKKADNPWGRNAGYLVFRLRYLPTYLELYYLNTINPSDVAAYSDFLYNVGKNISRIDDPNVNQTTDYNLDPGIYYYVVITYNIFGTLADIGNVAGDIIPGVQPVRPPDRSFDLFLQIIVVILVVAWAVIPIAGYSITRGLAKRDLIDFTMDVNVIKGFQGPKSFEKDVSELDVKMRKELGMDVSSPSETEFLQQEIVKSVAGVEVKESTLKNCPQCGWVLSAGAIKCIRCGYVIGTPTDQSKEGKK